MDLSLIPNADVFQRTEPRALINLVPSQVQAAMLDAQKKEPELFGLDERDLFKRLRQSERSPSPTDNRIRLAFWMEYDSSQAEGRDFNIARAYSGICNRQFFYQHYLHSAARVAWLITAPVGYETKMEEALDYGLDRMREYLELDATKDGKPNVKLMELQAKIVAMFEMRVKGGIVQRTETKNLNLSVSTTDRRVAQATAELSMEALEKRLRELDKRERAITAQTPSKPEEIVLEPDPSPS